MKTYYKFICVWIFMKSIVFMRFNHVVSAICSLLNSILSHEYITLSIPLMMDIWIYFQLWAISINSAAMYIL